MHRTSVIAVCLLAAAILLSCSRNGPPNSLFDRAGYHVITPFRLDGSGAIFVLELPAASPAPEGRS